MRKLLTKILSVIVAVTATLGLVMLPKTSVQANEEQFTFGATYGASVRYGDDIEVGLRFTIEVDKEYYKTLIGDEYESKNIKFGALVAPLWYVTNDLGGVLAINPEDENIADVCYVDHTTKFDQQQHAESASHVYYATVTYRFDDEWKAEVLAEYAKEMPDASEEEIFTHAKLEALATELVCMPYHIVEGEEPVYAKKLSDARSMVKVANGAVIDGENLPSDFNSKYLSTLVESTSEIYIEENGTIYGATEADYNALNGATVTANADAGDVEFTIENGVLTNASEFFVGYEVGNYYYVTAFKGHEVYRIKYMYVTRAIDSIQEFEEIFTLDSVKSASYFDGYYILTKDLDGSSYVGKHVYVGEGTTFSGSLDRGFKGTFDGLGHTISNITFKYAGLFGHATAPTIKNLALTGVTLNSYYGSVFAHSMSRLWGKKFNEDGTPMLNGDGKNDWVIKEPTIENVYVQVKKAIWGGSKRINVLVDNSFPTSSLLYNVVVEYLNAEEDGILDGVYANTHNFGTIGGNEDVNMNKTLMFHNCFSISEAPLYSRSSKPYFAENQVEIVERGSNGVYIDAIGNVLDEKVNKVLNGKGLNPALGNFAPGIRAYDDYASLAKDAENNASYLETFNSKYWDVINGVPYWKGTYASKTEIVVTDKKGNVVDDIALNNVTPELNVDVIESTTGLKVSGQVVTANKEGLIISDNNIKLASPATGDGEFEVTVTATVNGVLVEKTIIVAYTNKIKIDGKVLYSQADKSLDLPSLKAALDAVNVSIKSLDVIDNYIVKGVETDTLELQTIISGTGADKVVDTAQEVTVMIDGVPYVLQNVYAYTKLIDEASDLNYFVHNYNVTSVITVHSGYYLVTKNLDMSTTTMATHQFSGGSTYPGGNDKANGAGFIGVFDGNGYIISNLTTQSNGIFGTVSKGAVIKNVAFKDVTINGGYNCLFGHTGVGTLNLSNLYISAKSIQKENDILFYQGMANGANIRNVVVDLSACDTAVTGWVTTSGGSFAPITKTVSTATKYYDSFTITKAPLLLTTTAINVAENKVTIDGSTVTTTDETLLKILQVHGLTLKTADVKTGVRTYDSVELMAKDADANAITLATFKDYWIVKNGVPYWKEIYKQNYALQVKQGDNVVDGEILVKDVKTELTLDILDMSGNPVEGATITAPEGITAIGNVIKLESEPASVGAYEVKVSAVVDGLTIEKWLTINYSNEYETDGKVLYSKYDQALDMPSLNVALNEVGIEDVETVTYIVDGEEVDSLDIDVIISGSVLTRKVDTAQKVSIKIGNKVVTLNNVYAYTRLIDEFSDLDWMAQPHIKVEDYTGSLENEPIHICNQVKADGTPESSHSTACVGVPFVFDNYDGYYLMTKNLNGAGLGADGTDYTIAGTTGSVAGKEVGLTGVFDGNGYTISNAIVQSRGIFGYVSAGLVKNVGFKNMTLTGHYSTLLAHAFSNYQLPGYTSKQIGGMYDIYVEGTKVPFTGGSNGEVGLLTQNNIYAYAQRVVVKHTISELEQKIVMGTYDEANNLYKAPKRTGVVASQYHYGAGNDNFFRQFYIIGDMPMQFMTGSTNTTWNKFIFAENLLKQKDGSEEYELINPVAYAFMEKALNATYQISSKNYNWSRIPNPTNTGVAFQIEILKNVRQYIDEDAMKLEATANATNLAKFSSDYWTVVDGVPTWNTLND